MLSVLASAWSLLIGIAMMMLANGLQGTLLGLRATIEGFSTQATGLIMTGYFVGYMIGSLRVPKLLGRVGHIRVFAALASMASVSTLLHGVFIDPLLWVAMRLVTGFCFAGLYVVAESWINDRATNETRGQLLAIYMVVVLGGVAAGQFLLNLSPVQGIELFVLASALVSLALVPMALTATSAPNYDTPTSITLKQLYKVSPLGVVGSLFTGLSHAAMFSMGAVFATKLGYSVKEVSFLIASMVIGGALLQWPIGRCSDRFDRRLVITVVTFAAAGLALLSIVAAGHSFVLLVISLSLFGGTALPLYSLSIAHTNDFLQPSQMLAASGTLVLTTGIGACAGPLVASLLMDWLGGTGFLWHLFAAHMAIGLFALYRMGMRAAKPLEEQRDYPAIAMRTSPIAAAIASEVMLDAEVADAREHPADS